MRKHSLLSFYVKCVLISLPFICLLVFYIVKDPFQVLRQYDDYDHNPVSQNEGCVSWIKYKRYRNVRHYDSFIFGNSCTKAYQSTDWLHYVSGSPLRMFANNESLGGVEEKLEALDRQPRQPVRNVLIVLEPSSFNYEHNDFMHVMPPEVSHKSEISFQTEFLQGFFSPKFLGQYIRYTVFHCDPKKVRGAINVDLPNHTRYTNDAVLPQERRIAAMGEAYWKQDFWKPILSKKRYPKTLAPTVCNSTKQIELLKNIHDICKRHHTNLKVVISPKITYEIINPNDVKVMRQILGPNTVYDFSSKEYFWMDDYHNFYDGGHYSRGLAKKILAVIYGYERK